VDDPRDILAQVQAAVAQEDWPVVGGLAERLRLIACQRVNSPVRASAESGHYISVQKAEEQGPLSADYIYRNKEKLSFVRRVGKRKLAVDSAGYSRWARNRPPS